MALLARSIAVLERRRVVSWQDFFLVLKVGFDVIPQNRSKHIAALCGTSEWSGMRTSVVAKQTGYSLAGAELPLEDLVALELLGMNPHGANNANEWYLSEKTREYFRKMLVAPDSELAGLREVFPKGLTPYDQIIDQLIALREKEGEEIMAEAVDESPPEMS